MRHFEPNTDGWHGQHREFVLVGPPGTGKTRAILDAWLVPAFCADVDVRQVLACSFTKAAAGTMRERLAEAIDRSADELKRVCSTIHSEALRIVKMTRRVSVWDGKNARKVKSKAKCAAAGDEDDIEMRWETLDTPQSDLRKEAERCWGLARNLRIDIERTASGIGHAVDRLASAGKFRTQEIVAEILAIENEKRDRHQVDFTDMLTIALGEPAPMRELLVVDEAQDLSPLQVALVRHWAENAERLVWVADPDQAIFAFAGADGQYLTTLLRDGVEHAALLQSWRVPGVAHAWARRVILQNRDREDAAYLPTAEDGRAIQVKRPEEALGVIAQTPGTWFVLSRICADLSPYAGALAAEGEPFLHERGSSPWGQRGKPRVESDALLGLHDLVVSGRTTKGRAKRVIDALPAVPKLVFFAGKKLAALDAHKAFVGDAVTRAQMSAWGVMLDWSERGVFEGLDAIEREHREIGAWAKKYAAQRLIVERHGWDALEREPRITLTSIHASKGLERDHCVVISGPQWVLQRHPGEIAEERRILYVALTRCRRTLVLHRTEQDTLWRVGL
ncbi:MAG: ATP-dependent helicase [Gemmatimonadaceae bacterium]|jgi:superfamily I DNA/RNA helicase